MLIERVALGALPIAFALAGCTPIDTGFGDSVKTNMAVQVIDPDVTYGAPLASAAGATMAPAVERYRTDKVKTPKGIRTTTGISGQSGASSR